MNEIFGVLTAFGVIIGGDKVTGPLPCEKEITSSVEAQVLRDEGGKLGENIKSERHQVTPGSYDILYKIRRLDGSEGEHSYHVVYGNDCKNISVNKQ